MKKSYRALTLTMEKVVATGRTHESYESTNHAEWNRIKCLTALQTSRSFPMLTLILILIPVRVFFFNFLSPLISWKVSDERNKKRKSLLFDNKWCSECTYGRRENRCIYVSFCCCSSTPWPQFFSTRKICSFFSTSIFISLELVGNFVIAVIDRQSNKPLFLAVVRLRDTDLLNISKTRKRSSHLLW